MISRFVFLLALLSARSLIAEKPFDFESTPGKLPKTVVPEEYAIRIQPDLKKLTFTGSETIKLTVRKPARELVLNSADIQVASASINDKPVAKLIKQGFAIE
jgi:aminopeptidase N